MIYSINGQKFDSDFLEHHGVKGQKWGVRRYQNSDGTWTELGKQMRRNGKLSEKAAKAEAEKKLLQRWYAGDFDYDHNEADKQIVEVFKKVRDDIFDGNGHGVNGSDDTRTHTPEMARLVRQMDKLRDQTYDIEDRAWRDADKKVDSTDPANFEKWLKEYKQLEKQYGMDDVERKIEPAKRKIDIQILKELGYEVTEENIKLIRGIWEWD